jgi:hypothetical protein
MAIAIRTSTALLAVCVLGSAGVLAGDEIHLIDGRVIEGEVTSPPEAATVDIRSGAGSLVAIQHFERAKVARIVYKTSPRQARLGELAARRAALTAEASADDCYRLALQFREAGESAQAKELAGEAVARDRQHAEARKLLGQALYNGVWMRPAEIALARGEVFFDGRWMPFAEREAILADQARRREEAAVARKALEERRRSAALAAASSEMHPPTAVPGSYSYGYLAGNPLAPYRAVYWPAYGGYPVGGSYLGGGGYVGGGYTGGYSSGGYCPRPVVSINASGGGAHHAWDFHWNF